MMKVNGKTESSMERGHMSTQIKTPTQAGGCSERSMGKGPILTTRLEPS